MVTPSTAARDTANFDRHYATILEEWEDDFEEVIFEENVLLWILNMVSRHWKTGGRDITMAFSSVKNGTAEAFNGTQQLQIEAPAGPSVALWKMKNYKVSMTEVFTDSIENSGESAVADRFQEQIENAEGALAELLDDAMLQGQGNGSLHFEGLEDAVYAGANSTAPQSIERGTSAGNAFPTSVNNTYAGIDRSGSDSAATGRRNLSSDMNSAGTFASGITGNASLGLKRAKNLLSRGGQGPDLILMSLAPYESLETLGESVVRFDKGVGGAAGAMNFPFESLKHGSAMVVKYENADCSTVGGAANDADAGEDMIYILNTRYWRLSAETQAWFSWTDWVDSADVLARVSHLVVRLSPRCIGPRWQGALWAYAG